MYTYVCRYVWRVNNDIILDDLALESHCPVSSPPSYLGFPWCLCLTALSPLLITPPLHAAAPPPRSPPGFPSCLTGWNSVSDVLIPGV